MTWNNIEIKSGIFLKVEGGTFVDIHILNDHPKKELVHGGGKDRVSCGPGCHLCDDPDLPKEMRQQERWKTNIWDRRENKVKIWEFGAGLARQIKEIAAMLAESGETVQDVDFRISATGSGLSKKYTLIQKPKSGMLPSDLKLHQL